MSKRNHEGTSASNVQSCRLPQAKGTSKRRRRAPLLQESVPEFGLPPPEAAKAFEALKESSAGGGGLVKKSGSSCCAALGAWSHFLRDLGQVKGWKHGVS